MRKNKRRPMKSPRTKTKKQIQTREPERGKEVIRKMKPVITRRPEMRRRERRKKVVKPRAKKPKQARVLERVESPRKDKVVKTRKLAMRRTE